MRSFLKKLLIENWPRKFIAIILSIVIWMFVNASITTNKTLHNIHIKIVNIPEGKTIEGLQKTGFLNKTISITLTGSKSVLNSLTSSDIEIILSAENQKSDWNVSITPKNIKCLDPEVDTKKDISKVIYTPFTLKISNLTSERIPIQITRPKGKPPSGYLFLDIWPYKLYVTVTGPSNVVKQLKQKGLTLSYDLSDISSEDLEKSVSFTNKKDEISFFIPDSWKKIVPESLSSIPIQIDDPMAKELRIDFTKHKFLPLNNSIPITLFFQEKSSDTINPNTHKLATNKFVQDKNGIKFIDKPLFAHGVSRLFLDTIKDMIQLVVIIPENNSKKSLLWNVEFIYPHELEDRYVAKLLSEANNNNQPKLQEDYLRNRFRNYMNKFRLYTPDNEKLSLNIDMENDFIKIEPKNYR